MEDDRFEWSDAKARTNLVVHDVSFDYGEDRFNAIGMVKGELLTVTYCATS